jgi:glycosyltransferase involved in cell wall biosynthesis
MAHGLGTLLEAAEHLRDDPRIIFLLVGDGAERAKLEALKAKKCLDNVVILGQRPKSEMPEIWAATDVSLVMLRRSDAFKRVLPSKMFEAMAMGCPIILGVEGEACELLTEAQAGIPITPESASELAAAILHLATEREAGALYGARGSAYVRAHFDRQKLAEHYIRVLNAVAAGRSLPRDASAYASRLAAKRP